MFDLRPPAHVVGLILIFLGASMLVPAAVDWQAGSGDIAGFVESAIFTAVTGVLLSLATYTTAGTLSLRQTFAMTAAIWIAAAMFGSLPFMLGYPQLGLTDAAFESASGITTTGSSVIAGLERMPPGILLWRGMLNWFGGLGIAFVAMVFFPFLRVGGMKFFQVEGFDTLGKVLPRAADIARLLLGFYVGITLACAITYGLFGMSLLDAVVNAMATIATGGFSTADASFGKYHGAIEYAGALFMILGSLPYIRFVQMARGAPRPMLRDPQVRAYLAVIAVAVGAVVLWRLATSPDGFEPILRGSLFNIVSVISCTGFATDNIAAWGAFPVAVTFLVGLIGGCTSSSSGAISVFRWQILLRAIRSQILQIHHPARIEPVKYDGVTVPADVMDPVVMFFTLYILTIGIGSVLVGLSGIDPMSSIFAVWTSIGNIGYGFGDALAQTGTFVAFPTFAKWVLIAIMLLGRLGFAPILVLLMPRFWRW